jgi:hypothetical protein
MEDSKITAFILAASMPAAFSAPASMIVRPRPRPTLRLRSTPGPPAPAIQIELTAS